MIVSNMPYGWTLIRKVFNLKSFLRNASYDDGEEVAGSGRGSAVSLRGFSVRQASEVRSSAGKKHGTSWKIANWKGGSRMNETSITHSAAQPSNQEWLDTRLSADDKIKGPTAHKARSSSSSDLVVKQPRTGDVLDKLYPLDDLDDEVEKEMEREEIAQSPV